MNIYQLYYTTPSEPNSCSHDRIVVAKNAGKACMYVENLGYVVESCSKLNNGSQVVILDTM